MTSFTEVSDIQYISVINVTHSQFNS